jgi:hypothetical protein
LASGSYRIGKIIEDSAKLGLRQKGQTDGGPIRLENLFVEVIEVFQG